MDDENRMGEALLADVQRRRIPEGALGLWWIGQSSFIIRGGGITIYVDPYLNPSPKRIVPPPHRAPRAFRRLHPGPLPDPEDQGDGAV